MQSTDSIYDINVVTHNGSKICMTYNVEDTFIIALLCFIIYFLFFFYFFVYAVPLLREILIIALNLQKKKHNKKYPK